jgi:hypothetical protein
MLPVRAPTVRPRTTAVVAKVVATQAHDEVAAVHALHERLTVTALLPLMLLREGVERDPAVVLGAVSLAVGRVPAEAARLLGAFRASDVAVAGLALDDRDKGGAVCGVAVDAFLGRCPKFEDLLAVPLHRVS